jgi:hypothetical protein
MAAFEPHPPRPNIAALQRSIPLYASPWMAHEQLDWSTQLHLASSICNR